MPASVACQAVLGTDSFEWLEGLNLSPNPAGSFVTINVSAHDLPDSYTVYNSLGQVIASKKVQSSADLTFQTAELGRRHLFRQNR